MGLGQFRFAQLRGLGRARDCWIGVGIAAAAVSAVVFASASGRVPAGSPDLASPGGAAAPASSNFRLAKLRGALTAGAASAVNDEPRTSRSPATDGAISDERSASLRGERSASFDERFALAPAAGGRAPASVQSADWLAWATYVDALKLEEAREAMRRRVAEAEAQAQAQAPAQAAVEAKPNSSMRLAYAPTDDMPADAKPTDVAPSKNAPAQTAPSDALSGGKRTAIYDISARVVYLPNGERLEAHSGYGDHMDDLRSVRIRNLGITPPNVYKLSLRESLFHGVRAVRMTPVTRDRMYGRDGFLVHPYMLGPNGQSNGCVSIDDYDTFLEAFLKGKVDHMVVVERLPQAPPPKVAAATPPKSGANRAAGSPPAKSGANQVAGSPPPKSAARWLAERIRALFHAS